MSVTHGYKLLRFLIISMIFSMKFLHRVIITFLKKIGPSVIEIIRH